MTGQAGLGVDRWPPRRPPHGPRKPPRVEPKAVESKRPQTPEPVAAGPVPFFVPSSKKDALIAGVVDLLVLAILALFLYYLWLLWLPERLPSQVVYFLILGLTVITVFLFVVSLLVYVLPRLLGIRGPPGEPRPAGTKP